MNELKELLYLSKINSLQTNVVGDLAENEIIVEDEIPINTLQLLSGEIEEELFHCSCHAAIANYVETLKEPCDFDEGLKREFLFNYTITPISFGKEPLINVYTAAHGTILPGELIATNKPKHPTAADEVSHAVINMAKDVHEFWINNFEQFSHDGKGGPINVSIHYDQNFNNAFWNGKQIVIGDGNNKSKFLELSIFAHEFGHALTGNKLAYSNESGSLHEHLSDVWGALTVQYKNNHSADQASWLLGEHTLKFKNKWYAVRSMKEPGKAHPADFQPQHYSKLYEGPGDIHINCGIPNKAFYLFASAQGGKAWEKPGRIWYNTIMTPGLVPFNCTFYEFAAATLKVAKSLYPNDETLQLNLKNAWAAVGCI